MICPKCGKELKAHSKFCSYCGTAIQKEEEFQSEKSSGVSPVREQQKLLIILFSVSWFTSIAKKLELSS